MSRVDVRPADECDIEWLDALQDEHWGGSFQVANGELYRPAELPGVVAEIDGERVGYAALRIVEGIAWIGLIQSLHERRGIGTALVGALIDGAAARGCRTLRAITTNDNSGAQAFYTALGFRVVALRPGAIAEARKLKPSIPALADDGTPIVDEIEYELSL